MKSPEFNPRYMMWDQFKQFHQPIGPHNRDWHGGFLAFIGGEMLCVQSRFNVDERVDYNAINITVFNTSDPNTPQLYDPGGEAILKAWLTDEGSQALLYDHDTHKAVQLAPSHWDSKQWDIPEWARGECTAYFAGPGREPKGNPITVSRAHEWDREEWQHVEGLRAACEAWAMIENKEKNLPKSKPSRFVKKFETIVPWGMLRDAPDFMSLSDEVKLRVARFGITRRRDVTTYPYLTGVAATPDALAAAKKLKDEEE